MKPTLKTYALVFLAVILVTAAGYSAWQYAPKEPALNVPESFSNLFQRIEVLDKPKKLPSIALYSVDGGTDAALLSDLKGKWTLVNLWATWCPPCIIELPTLIDLREKGVGKGFDVVLVSFDFPDDVNALKTKMKSIGLPENTGGYYVQDVDIWQKLGVSGLPTSYLVGPDGHIYMKMMGDIDWTAPEALDFFQKLGEY